MNGVNKELPSGLPLHRIGLLLCVKYSGTFLFSTQEALVFAIRDKMFVRGNLSGEPSEFEWTDRVSSTAHVLVDVTYSWQRLTSGPVSLETHVGACSLLNMSVSFIPSCSSVADFAQVCGISQILLLSKATVTVLMLILWNATGN